MPGVGGPPPSQFALRPMLNSRSPRPLPGGLTSAPDTLIGPRNIPKSASVLVNEATFTVTVPGILNASPVMNPELAIGLVFVNVIDRSPAALTVRDLLHWPGGSVAQNPMNVASAAP